METTICDLICLVKKLSEKYNWDIDDKVDAFVVMLEHFKLNIISDDIDDWMLRKQLTFILSEEILK